MYKIYKNKTTDEGSDVYAMEADERVDGLGTKKLLPLIISMSI